MQGLGELFGKRSRESGIEEFTLRHGGRGHGHGKFCGAVELGSKKWLVG